MPNMAENPEWRRAVMDQISYEITGAEKGWQFLVEWPTPDWKDDKRQAHNWMQFVRYASQRCARHTSVRRDGQSGKILVMVLD